MARLIPTLLFTSLLAGSSVAQQSNTPSAPPMSGMGMMAPSATDSASTKAYKAAMMKMMHGMSMMSLTGDADMDFMTQMRAHHQGAIDMANIVVANGKDEATKTLAKEIIMAQQKELVTIDAWLKARGK